MTSIKHKIAAQMYSLRAEFAENPEYTFQKLKEIGYEAIQLDGMRGHDPKKIAELVDKYDFKIAGMHIKHERFMHDLDGIIEEAYLFGCKIIYDKYIEDEEQNESGYRLAKKNLLQAIKILAPLGFRIGLHCPEYDYTNEIDGRNVLSYITDPEFGYGVYAEPDTYWMKVTGEDPVEAIKAYSGRAPILHLKDFKEGFENQDEKNSMTEVGYGSIDMAAIIRWGEKNKVEYYCVEQDYSQIGIFESMKKSFDYLVSLDN